MLILLTPSKTMDFTTPLVLSVHKQQPLFLEKARHIATQISKLNEAEIMQLMKVSAPLAKSVKERYGNWPNGPQKPALWAYKGDVYKGMKADELTQTQAEWAEKHILIMSGLYGMVRPFDPVSPYRLEMKTKLPVAGKKDLYDFWGTQLADYVAEHANDLVYNLCSDEYGDVVIKKLSKTVRIITPVFYDNRPNGTVGRAPIYNKMMRGVVARWMIDHKTERPEDLKKFTGHDYSYDSSRSTPDTPAFYREKMKPLVF